MSIFKVFTKLPKSRSDEGNLENFENTSEINSYCTRHLRLLVYHMQGKILYKGQLSRSCHRESLQVFRLSLKNRL